MAKLQSSFKNMALSLTCIALVAAGALAGVYMLTIAPIEAAMKAKQEAAIMQVLPQVEGLQVAEAQVFNGLTYYKAYVGIWGGPDPGGDSRYIWTSSERAT